MENNGYAAAVIVAVYNNWPWLRHILEALQRQTAGDFEVLIADDGSSADFTQKIKHWTQKNPGLKVAHLWQPDEGFRKTRMLNRCVLHTSAPRIIFLDGDCIPHPEFVSDHLRLLRKGLVVAGRRVDLFPSISRQLEDDLPLPDDFFAHLPAEMWRRRNQTEGSPLRPIRRALRYPIIPLLPHLFGQKRGILGCNFSVMRDDILSVGGFDSRFEDPGWGEDVDLEARMKRAGFKIRKFSNHCLVAHRFHRRLDQSSPRNIALFEENNRNAVTRTPFGTDLLQNP